MRGSGQRPDFVRRFARGESKNSPVDCFLRGNALQERAFPKWDVEDAVPYIFQRADNIRPYKHKTDLLYMILFSAKGNI